MRGTADGYTDYSVPMYFCMCIPEY
jgi:hypothetical protein